MSLRASDLEEMAETVPMSTILETLSTICIVKMKSASDQKTKRNGPALYCYRITAKELEKAARRFRPER